MKRLAMVGMVIFGCVAGGINCQHSTLPPAPQDQAAQAPEQALPAQRQVPTLPPPPPPPPTAETAEVRFLPDPPRALVGIASKQLRQVEAYLPEGSAIETFPISDTQEKAAIATVDLDGDGTQETIVAFNNPQTNGSLFLGVLAPDGDKLTLRSSLRLPGTYVYGNIYDSLDVPFAARDVTGDSVPEILITSSQGASIGAQLQVFSFDGQSLQEIVFIGGNNIRLIDRGFGRSAIIKAYHKDDFKEQRFEWKGSKFEEVR
jgi:hypothetical protein